MSVINIIWELSMRAVALSFVLWFSILFLSSCSDKDPEIQLDEVTIQLKWAHQSQFAGFYLAQENGYYEEENLKVNFIEGGLGVNITDKILSGEADFSVITPEVAILKRKHISAPITAIAAIYRRSATVYVSRDGSGIRQPIDFSGKTISVLSTNDSSEEFLYQLKAMMNKLKISMSDIKLVQYDPKYTDFLEGKVDITAAYYTSGVIKLRKKGLKLNLIWPGDYDIQLYSDILVTTEDMINNQPKVVQRFLRATLKGWRHGLGNANEAVEATLKYVKNKDFQFQMDMLNGLRPLVDTGQDHIGWMTKEAWHQMHEILVDQKIIATPLQDIEKVYTIQFLHSIYGAPKP